MDSFDLTTSPLFSKQPVFAQCGMIIAAIEKGELRVVATGAEVFQISQFASISIRQDLPVLRETRSSAPSHHVGSRWVRIIRLALQQPKMCLPIKSVLFLA